MEVQSTVAVEGHAWAMQEVTPATRLADLYRNSCGGRTPPAAVMQHAAAPRQLVVLSAQGANMNAYIKMLVRKFFIFIVCCRVADLHHFQVYPDPVFHLIADPDQSYVNLRPLVYRTFRA
jgi:hypothetical protein